MSLATRCTACGTAFRVVQDQLKVSEGWVRCGRCGEVFNAIEGLFDLERDAPPSASPPGAAAPAATAQAPRAPAPAAAAPAPTIAAGATVSATTSARSSVTAPRSGGTPAPAPAATAQFLVTPDRNAPPPTGAATAPATPSQADQDEAAPTAYEVLDSRFLAESTYRPERLREASSEDFADARFDSRLEVDAEQLRDEVPVPAKGERPEAAGAGARKRSRTRVRAVSDATPDFLRQAERAERWRTPGMRALLAMLALVLLAALATQVALHFRDTLAVRQPALRPWLARACQHLHCELGPPRRIDDVVVDSSSLARQGGAESYRLTVQLRNRGDLPLATPWIDLSLTDADGRLVARRSVPPDDFRAPASLAARQEATLTLDFSTPGQRVTGYTVEAFYP
ncbi:MAG TPA: zinc-ribbon and DUF3426 domain-containing protein [Burkholderiaceae bacterium]|nr:zinc-ribbon and DUF3426 domain-containing protein [Burkholderiaceae bacterium]